MTNKEFFDLISKYKKTVNPLGATAQCSHETRYKGVDWNSDLWKKANNPAGIKTLNGWKGSYINSDTWEQSSDGTVSSGSKQFLKFNSVEDGIAGYVDKVKQNYPKATESVDNVWGYLYGIMNGKYGPWATDLSYFDKLVDSVIRVAPECLGDDIWKSKLDSALTYAIKNKRITDKEANIIKSKLDIKNPVIEDNKDTSTKKLKGFKIVIDPGHGKPDSGAVGYSKKIYEMNVVLSVAKKLDSILKANGADVKLTRDIEYQQYSNKSKDLQYRCDVSNNFNANVFLSIHCNSSSDSNSNGFEAYTSPGQTKADKLCDIIYKLWEKAFPDMRMRKGNLKYTVGKESNLYVLKHTKAPAVLVELGFINNKNEEQMLNSEDFQNKAAKVLEEAIIEFLV